TEPAAKVSHSPYHMAAPTATAETVGRPIPPPPAPEIAAKVSHFPPPFPPQPDAPAPKRRKLEEAGFHTSAYYKIRAAVADLRLRFVQVRTPSCHTVIFFTILVSCYALWKWLASCSLNLRKTWVVGKI
uniref:Uncharacterized protein n=1 Tax=Aegilops tauschii subsp. strangulata TaxID=200361 RepID=A0A453P805_AEGTS